MRNRLAPHSALRTPHSALRWPAIAAAGAGVLLLGLVVVALARLIPGSGEFSPFGLEFRQQDQLRGGGDTAKLSPGARSVGQGFRSPHANLSSVAVQLGSYSFHP